MLSSSQVKEIQKIRQILHKYPELSGHESETAKFIRGYLERFGADEIIDGIGGDGILGIFEGKNSEKGKTLMVRAELDALAILEQGELPYKSENVGVMHACGHDGHMAMVLGVGKWLQNNQPENGRVLLLFQPAEETGRGSGAMLEDPAFKSLEIDRAIALHNLPGYEKNVVFLKTGTFASASIGLKIQFHGQSSHAAYPRQGVNPSMAISKLVQTLEEVKNKALSHDKFRVLTVTYIKVGEPAFGINPGRGEMGVTVRAETDAGITDLIEDVEEKIKAVKKSFEGNISIKKKEPFSATINDEYGANRIKTVADCLDTEVRQLEHPFAWSEDFGEFRKKCPITLFGLGSGTDVPALHSETYDFDDELIPTGTALFCEWIKQMKDE